MTTTERIAKLEALLSRVRERTLEAPPMAAAVPPVMIHSSSGMSGPVSSPFTSSASIYGSRPTRPSNPAGAAHEDGDVDVEVSTEAVEVDIDVDEGHDAMAMESGAQPVAQAYAQDDDFDDVTMSKRSPASLPVDDESESVTVPPAAANELIEEEPSSSPRAIADAYEQSAPRHTPPPESGKQVATPTPAPRRGASPVPPSNEAMMGSWHEPGIPRDVASSPLHPPSPAPPEVARPAAPVPMESGRRLGADVLRPDVTRPDLPAMAKIASFENVAPIAKPATFGDLVDGTLSL